MKHVLSCIMFFVFLNPEIHPQDVSTVKERITSLIEQFKNEDLFINGDAVNEIARFGEDAVPSLLLSLGSDNENIRYCSAIALEKIAPAGKQAIPYLIKSLNDKNPDVKWTCILALGKFRHEAISAIPDLQKLLYDNDYDIRWAAYLSLFKIDKNSLNVRTPVTEIIDKIENLVPSIMKELNVPGVSLSLIDKNEIIFSKSYGYSDAATHKLTDSRTMFEACSLSKPVFAYLVMLLAEQKKIDLDKPLYGYLPEEFISDDDDYSEQITARMVMTHTSGMPNWRQGGEERNGPLPVYFKPGTRFSYSGEGFYYLQRAVEKITGEPLNVLAKRNLFDKLGLKDLSYIWTPEQDYQISTGHDTSGSCKKRGKYTRPDAAYTLYTSADDYAKILIDIMKPGSLLSDFYKNEMLSHQFRSDIREVTDRPGRNLGLYSYRGLGWAIDSTITGNIFYHSGSNQTGFRCYCQFDPENKTGIVIMTNGDNGSEFWQRLIKKIGDL